MKAFHRSVCLPRVVSEAAERESFDPIDFIFAEEIENIKGAILSSALAPSGRDSRTEGRKAEKGEKEPNPRRQ